MIDPAPHEIYQQMVRPTDISQEQFLVHRGASSSLRNLDRVGDVPNAAVTAGATPSRSLDPESSKQFHDPPPLRPVVWRDDNTRVQNNRGTYSFNPVSGNNSSPVVSVPRRSHRDIKPAFQHDSRPSHQFHQYNGWHSSGPLGPGVRGGGGGICGSVHPLVQPQQHCALLSQRAGPAMLGTRGRSPMRPLPPGAGGGPPRLRPEHNVHLMGPLWDSMFFGAPTAYGAGSRAEEVFNLTMETVSRVLIPNCKIGAVIGKGGAIIKHIREVSGAKVTISDSCTGLYNDADDRMVTATGTFNSVQLAFVHILSHVGALGPGADPVMGLAGGDPDCAANSFRLLIPNVKAGGLIGRGGCTIKAIREQSGARIEISSNAFHFHPVHGTLPGPAPVPLQPTSNRNSHCGHGGYVSCPRSGNCAVTVLNSSSTNGASAGGCGVGTSGSVVNGIALPPPILMDRVLSALGSFDACLRVHHLVTRKLLDVKPSPVPMPSSAPPLRPPGSATGTFAGGAQGVSGVQGPLAPPSRLIPFGNEPFKNGKDEWVLTRDRTAVKLSTTPDSATSSAPVIRQPWNCDNRAWRPVFSSPPPESDSSESSETNAPLPGPCLSLRGSPRGSTSGSVEDFSPTSNARSTFTQGLSSCSVDDQKGDDVANHDGPDSSLEEKCEVKVSVNGDDGKIPDCLAGIIDSFFGGRSENVDARPPRSPSMQTGIEVAVGRAAFALLGVRDLDNIKKLSGAGIIAPESPVGFGNVSDDVMAAAAAAVFSSTARGNAPAEGFGLAAAMNQAVTSDARSASSHSDAHLPRVRTVPVESFSKEADDICGMSSLNHRCYLSRSGIVAGEGKEAVGASMKLSGVVYGGESSGSSVRPKMVRITGTAEEVQLAEYLIRVRTAGRDMAAA